MNNYTITVLKGDGIGPEVVNETIEVLDCIAKKFKFSLSYQEALIGGIAIDETGEPLPKETVDKCKASDAVLLGAVGGEKWDTLPGNQRPEAGLLGIRQQLGLFSNLRPARIYKALKDASPLKDNIIKDGLDILVVRELTGGIYFGERNQEKDEAYDTMKYKRDEVIRIAKSAFEAAMKRNKKVTSVDKANVLDNSRLWREVVIEVAKDYPEIELNHMYVDNAAMQLVKFPSQFDVIVTGNMFGDILSDEASMITGSIGMLPSASLSEGTFGLYEPVHGSAPDIAGKGIANPMATMLSAAMMLRHSFNEVEAADEIEAAIEAVLNEGYRTRDLEGENTKEYLSTKEVTKKVLEKL